MDSDDDYQSFSPSKEPSPQAHYRRLKRLKKSNSKPSKDPSPESVDDPLLFPHVDFAKLEALENDSEFQDCDGSNSNEETTFSQQSLSQETANENVMKEDELKRGSDKEVKKAKRVLEFDDDVMGGVDGNGTETQEDSGFEIKQTEKEKMEEENLLEEKEDKKKKKKKRAKGGSDELNTNARRSNKRSENKERKAYLEGLHAESQRLLRETSDASFKPVPVVQKPISSILDKIRKRKLEISKKAMIENDRSYGYEGSISPQDKLMDLDVSNKEKKGDESVAAFVDGESRLAALSVDECNVAAELTINGSDQNQVSPDESHTPAFRAPVDDTQDLFDDLEPIGATAEENDEQPSSPLQEDFAPSLLAMNLKFDSAPVDVSDLDEEDNDKENVEPHPHEINDGSSSPRGDPVKFFVDDEAEEEDDSDNDIHRFQENEEDYEIDDFEELNDMIATECEERSVDIERRNALHQKWLEHQDAAGTDNLMQKLKCGSALRDTFLSDDETKTDTEDEAEEGEDIDDEAKEDSLQQNSTRVTTKKAKQIILQMLADKEDAYVSDGDDENTQKMHARCLLIRKEEQATVVSPSEDETSREVFGLIKKLNIAPDPKRKPKAVSIFDSMFNGNSNSSKSSFRGIVSKHPISTSQKKGSGSARSYIFGRDDSSSRSSISVQEDSSDTVNQDTRPTRNCTAKYSSSQLKYSNSRDGVAESETSSNISLLDVLRRSSSESSDCNKESIVDLTKGIFAFRAPKKPMKMEGRS